MKLFSTEQVSKWHPDKYADQISDAILRACLLQDKTINRAENAEGTKATQTKRHQEYMPCVWH